MWCSVVTRPFLSECGVLAQDYESLVIMGVYSPQDSVIKPTRSWNLGVVVGCYGNRQQIMLLFLVQSPDQLNNIKSILEDNNTNMAT